MEVALTHATLKGVVDISRDKLVGDSPLEQQLDPAHVLVDACPHPSPVNHRMADGLKVEGTEFGSRG